MVTGGEQREVVPDIVRGGERRADVQLQHAPVAEQRNLRQSRRHGGYFRYLLYTDLHVREHEVLLGPVHVVRDHDEDDGGVGGGRGEGGHGAAEVSCLEQAEAVQLRQVVAVVRPPVVEPDPGHRARRSRPEPAPLQLAVQQPLGAGGEARPEGELPPEVGQVAGEGADLVVELETKV